MPEQQRSGVLLALDASVGETGWAVVDSGSSRMVEATGVIKTPGPRKSALDSRVDVLLADLDALVQWWRPSALVQSRPSRIHWPVPALELLEARLCQWAGRHLLPLYAYTAKEVRLSIVGKANASRDSLNYAVMEQLGLIGQSKTTHEWEALAAAYYHLQLPGLNLRAA